MASAWENFKLGAAYFADKADHALGGSSTLAADVYAEQTAGDQGLDKDQEQQIAMAAENVENLPNFSAQVNANFLPTAEADAAAGISAVTSAADGLWKRALITVGVVAGVGLAGLWIVSKTLRDTTKVNAKVHAIA